VTFYRAVPRCGVAGWGLRMKNDNVRVAYTAFYRPTSGKILISKSRTHAVSRFLRVRARPLEPTATITAVCEARTRTGALRGARALHPPDYTPRGVGALTRGIISTQRR